MPGLIRCGTPKILIDMLSIPDAVLGKGVSLGPSRVALQFAAGWPRS